MLVDLQSRLLHSLSRLQIQFTVVGPNKDIADFVAVEISDEAECKRRVAEEKRAIVTIENIINQRA